jgi:hypothetical protein
LHLGIEGLGDRHRSTLFRSSICKRNEYLLGLGILDGSDEAADLVAHGLRSDARGCRFEVNIACTSDASVRYESGCRHGADKSRCSDTVEAARTSCSLQVVNVDGLSGCG